MKNQLSSWVECAKQGDKRALEMVVEEIQTFIYNLSLKMLLFPEDAQDASQEILIKVITHLGTFKGESRFETWVYRIATNYLISAKGKKSQHFARSFEAYEQLIDTGQSEQILSAKNEGELRLLEEEVMISCTYGLLLCLGPKQRMVYILGEILYFSSIEGAAIMDLTPSNFRQILSRARQKIRGFLQKKCGIIEPSNACRCRKKIDYLIQEEIISPHKLRYANPHNSCLDWIEKIRGLEKTVALYRSFPDQDFPGSLRTEIHQLIHSL